MPNIKSAKKRVKVTSVKSLQNKMAKTALRTIVKKFNTAVEGEDKAAAAAAYKTAVVAVDKAAVKGIIHKNNAANKKSSMARKMNVINAGA